MSNIYRIDTYQVTFYCCPTVSSFFIFRFYEVLLENASQMTPQESQLYTMQLLNIMTEIMILTLIQD
jgi:hypothetical protein